MAADGSPLEKEDPSGALRAQAEEALLRQVPPHNLEAEMAVLGAVLLNPLSLLDIEPILRDEDFYIPAHRLIYKTCLVLSRDSGAAVDMITVKNYLQEHALLEEAGGVIYLGDLVKIAVSSSRADYHARLVREKSQIRGLMGVCARIISNCFEPGLDARELLDGAERDILEVNAARADHNYRSSAELSNAAFVKITKLSADKRSLTGISTGYNGLNALTSGLQPSDLIILAARTGTGKTALALNLAANAAFGGNDSPGIPVAIFSLEMDADQLMQRLLCAEGRVDLSILRGNKLNDDDWHALERAADKLHRAPIFIDDTPALSIDALRSRARQMRHKLGIEFLVVDYLQLMQPSRKSYSREQEIAEISRGLKALAKELKIPVLALAQLNRDVEKREDKRPMLSDLRESGAIEQDADLIMFIHRKKDDDYAKPGSAELIIDKHRNGQTGRVHLRYIPAFTRFEEGASRAEY